MFDKGYRLRNESVVNIWLGAENLPAAVKAGRRVVFSWIDLMSMGVKIAIEPFEFLTEPSGVGCKGLIVRFTKNAVQSYIFRKKITKNKSSCHKNILKKCRRHLRPEGSGNTPYFGLPHRCTNISAFSDPPRNNRDFEYLLETNGPETKKGKRLSFCF